MESKKHQVDAYDTTTKSVSPSKKQKKEAIIPTNFGFIDPRLECIPELTMLWVNDQDCAPVSVIRREDLPTMIRVKSIKGDKTVTFTEGVTVYDCLKANSAMWRKAVDGQLKFDVTKGPDEDYFKWAMVRAFGSLSGHFYLGDELDEEKKIQVLVDGEWVDNDINKRHPGLIRIYGDEDEIEA